jgi:hypothetical protein
MDFTIVTAWYDVREKENHPHKDDKTNRFFCSMEWYFDNAKLLFSKPFPMVIFTEPRFKDIIMETRPKELHDKTRFIFKDYDELPFYSYFKKFEENHHKHPVHNLDANKFTPLYKFIVNQKTNFVKEVIEMNPFQTTRFAWMDLRLHCVYDMSPEETIDVIQSVEQDKVRIMFMSYLYPTEIHGRHDFYSWTRGKMAAGFFAGEREPLLQFARLCQKEFVDAVNAEMAPTDEMIYSFVTAYNPALFDPYVGEYCDCLRNLSKTRGSLHLGIPFFCVALARKNHSFLARLSRDMRRGHLGRDIHLPPNDINTVWYHGYSANYELGLHTECADILQEYLQLARENQEIMDYVRSKRDEFIERSTVMGHSGLVAELVSI